MNLCKVFSVTVSIVVLSLLITPGSDATGIYIGPLEIFNAAKLTTMALIGKGVLLSKVGIPVATKLLILKALKGAAVVGGAAGAKTGVLAASAKAPLFLAKSAIPNLLSLAPLLKGLGKKKEKGVVRAAPALPPMLPPPPPPMQPSYTPAAVRSSYAGAPPMGPPMAPTFSQPLLRL